MYQKLYASKDTNDFADVWQGCVEITAAIDKATQTKEPVIPVHYTATPPESPSRTPSAQDPAFGCKKRAGIVAMLKT